MEKERDLLEKVLAEAEAGYAGAYRFLLEKYEENPGAYGPRRCTSLPVWPGAPACRRRHCNGWKRLSAAMAGGTVRRCWRTTTLPR